MGASLPQGFRGFRPPLENDLLFFHLRCLSSRLSSYYSVLCHPASLSFAPARFLSSPHIPPGCVTAAQGVSAHVGLAPSSFFPSTGNACTFNFSIVYLHLVLRSPFLTFFLGGLLS